MSENLELSTLLAEEERFYALLEPSGLLHARWGSTLPSAKETLYFRKFHFPKMKSPSAWKDFLDSTSWALNEAKSFHHREVKEAAPIATPQAAARGDRAAWDSLCFKARGIIQSEVAHKLVPARQVSYELTACEHKSILGALAGRLFSPQMENAYRFVVKAGASIFFGATPELLFRREGGKILVPAIAGTRALAGDKSEATLRQELLASEKERAEHEWVVDGVRDALLGLGLKPIYPPEPSVLRVPRLLHLYTPVTAIDEPSVTGEQLLEALHPTPAIGGLPKVTAADFLFDHEPWDRGLFSAPLLFRSPDRELCLVAIRSGLLTPSELHLFAGAGYVKGSTPESEWEETERKLQVMQVVLFGENHGRK